MSPCPSPGPAGEVVGGRRVIVLSGPSGAGKSRLAERLSARYGWPIARLDDFYREGGDPALPLLADGAPDWDDPVSWHEAAAVEALTMLCLTGEVDVPTYDISASALVGHGRLAAGPGQLVVAEGIFAAESIAALRQRGLLAGAWCIRNRPWLTFWRRLVRDLAERRKPPGVLWRRGLRLCRQEPDIVARHVTLGAIAMTAAEAEQRAAALAADTRA